MKLTYQERNDIVTAKQLKMNNHPKVSIIIPVYNGERMLSLCLDSLMALNYPKERLGIIVVDNNSTDHTKDIIKKYPVQYLFEEKRSVARARNKGIENSTGEFIAFIDADCIADKNWISKLIEIANDEKIGGVGGKIIALNPQNWVEKYLAFNNFYCQCGEINEIKYSLPWITTANAVFRRDVFRNVGLFDLPWTVDVDFTNRIILAGYKIRIAPKAVVFHDKSQANFIALQFKRSRFLPYLHFKYKNIMKREFKNFLLKEIITTIISFNIGLFKIVKNIFTKKDTQSKIFSVLHIIGRMAHFFGYLLGWLEVASGIKKISSLNFNNKCGTWWWYEGPVLVIVDLSQNPPKYHYITGTGKRMWELLAIHGKSSSEIVNALTEEYEVTPDEIRADVEDFIKKLKKINLLKN